jgi:putative spermidine/putrescine transport system ATP-binding protein
MTETADAETRAACSFERVSRRFGEIVAVDALDLVVREGEFFTLLGPSGSGKTTCLRLLAGFERADAGRILLGTEDVTDEPPYRRDVNTVFQDYALFPHMNVAENVGYGLMVRKTSANERRMRVDAALELVRLGGYGNRKPAELSGGQRQRVAMARALVNRPRLLLLDEPLGALDLKLRQELQLELKRIQREVGITFVYVTHDQEEALTMSDRIAVFRAGRIEQIGTPGEIYEQPATAFVAGFVGHCNLIEAAQAERLLGTAGRFALRPERIDVHAAGDQVARGRRVFDARVAAVEYLGQSLRVHLELEAGARVLAIASPLRSELKPGTPVRASFDPTHARRLPG